MSGTWATRMSIVLPSASQKLLSWISRPQLKPGSKRHGRWRVLTKESTSE
jgi:hypothetical protein